MSDSSSKRNGLLAIAIVLLLLLGGGAWFVMNRARPNRAPVQPARAEPPIKVGVILSQRTAEHWQWKLVNKVMNEGLLNDPSFEAYAIVEPGTAQQGEIPGLCHKYFAGRAAIDCTDAARLRELDVIVAPYVSTLAPEMADAVEKLVRDQGKGLMIRAWLGVMSPGCTSRVLALNGLTEGQWGWNGRDVECEIISPHPILGDLAPGTRLLLEPNGAYGVMVEGGERLVVVTNMSNVGPATGGPFVTDRADFVHAPLYVSTFGKGRIVGCMFHGHKNDDVATSRFVHAVMPRAIRWLAGRAVK